MRAFSDKDFLLSSDMAGTLYRNFVTSILILNYHCRINPREIYEDQKFDTIAQIWPGGDHYKWRQMRFNGIDEKYMTGDSIGWEKFKAWARTMSKPIGSPLYHRNHLEPRKYSGYEGYLNGDTAKEVWDLRSAKLQESFMMARDPIKQSYTVLTYTIGDPVDSLEWHKETAEDPPFDVQVLPVQRPDKTADVGKPTFLAYMACLSEVSGIQATDFTSPKKVLQIRTDFLTSMGCCVSDHALEYVMYVPSTEAEVGAISAKGLKGEAVSKEEELKFKAVFMFSAAHKYNRMGWIMQVHYGYKRDNNACMLGQLGPDTGFDYINNYASSAQMADPLNALSAGNETPKTILCSLDPNDSVSTDTIISCFRDRFPEKIQHGSVWWFNDHKAGMMEQMVSLANQGYPGNFVGMLIDSRSFLPYTGHEYFRRILYELLGGWVESGKYPADMKAPEEIARGICHNNTVNYFGFELDTVKQHV